MSRRDSDSKRYHSKFDSESSKGVGKSEMMGDAIFSPKRYRRDGRQEREREREREREKDRVATNGGDHTDRDQRPNLPNRSKEVNKDVADKKSNDHNEPSKHSSDPTQPPRSHPYYQVGRNADRREAGGKVSSQSREYNEKVETGHSREPRDEKSHTKLDDSFQRRGGFSERKDEQPTTTRRRPAFREKKIPVDSGEVNPATRMVVKAVHTDQSSERNERKEEKSSNPNHMDRPEKQNADDRLPNRTEARRDGFSSRVRYGANGGNGNYRGRDRFHGRQGYQPTKTRAEKWKHDLYQEVNKDPTPKNDDDQIAKLEALLAS
ncbi:uncharacterized protein [Arachis hypogaea]|uniref:uncharacterized protein isoform X2 n=1 Tax=Arachis hypogaea TaxID=3818 RepID=UPI000DECF2E9|nr:splicing regulatory glutamine/lysine-rich protein 1 isoform X2 [Arachis hypogaea]